MPSPNFTFAFIIATLVSSIFHLIVGGDARRLALFLLAGWVGFALGQFFAQSFNIRLYAIGDIEIVVAFIGTFIALIVAFILSGDKKPTQRRNRTR